MGAAASKRIKRLSFDERYDYLKHTPFFIYLQDDTLREFTNCFPHVRHVGEGESPVLDNDKVYIVVEGELELKSTIPAADSKVENTGYLCKKYPGDIVSQRHAYNQAVNKLQSKIRKLEDFIEEVKIFARKPTILLKSDSERLALFRSKHPEIADPLDAIICSHIESYLSTIPFLRSIKSSQLSVLAAMCRYEAMDANEIIFEENSPGTKLYILLYGSATVLAPEWVGNATALQQSLEWGNEKGDGKVVVADLKSGDYFGETALFANINRTSTVLTKEKSLLVTVEKATFENFLMVCPIKDEMTAVMKERMVSKLSSLGIPFLLGIPNEKLKMLTNLLRIHESDEGDIIFHEGDEGDNFYIIVHGQVKVQTCNSIVGKDDKGELEESTTKPTSQPQSLGLLGPGNYFGEMSLVSEAPRSATVITQCKTILLSVDKNSFQSIFASNKQAIAEFRLRLLREESQLKNFLDHSLGISTFTSFLKKRHADENVEFWIEATKFQSKTAESELGDIQAEANAIFDKYCKEGAPRQVNLPHTIRIDIETVLEAMTSVTVNLFDRAIDEIYKLMDRDGYARFRSTPEFYEFFKCLGILLEDDSNMKPLPPPPL